MSRHPKCPQCDRRHGRVVLELRLFATNVDGGSEPVDYYRPDQIAEAIAELARYRALDVDMVDGPVDFGLDVWVADSESGDADPVEAVGDRLAVWVGRATVQSRV